MHAPNPRSSTLYGPGAPVWPRERKETVAGAGAHQERRFEKSKTPAVTRHKDKGRGPGATGQREGCWACSRSPRFDSQHLIPECRARSETRGSPGVAPNQNKKGSQAMTTGQLRVALPALASSPHGSSQHLSPWISAPRAGQDQTCCKLRPLPPRPPATGQRDPRLRLL